MPTIVLDIKTKDKLDELQGICNEGRDGNRLSKSAIINKLMEKKDNWVKENLSGVKK